MFQTAGGNPQVMGRDGLSVATQGGINQGVQIGGGRSHGNEFNPQRLKKSGQLATISWLPLTGSESPQQFSQHGCRDKEIRFIFESVGSISVNGAVICSKGLASSSLHVSDRPSRSSNFPREP
jgi:hypothetical protein